MDTNRPRRLRPTTHARVFNRTASVTFAYHLFEDAHRRVEVRQNLVDDVAAMSNGAIGQGEAHVTHAFEALGNGVEDLHES